MTTPQFAARQLSPPGRPRVLITLAVITLVWGLVSGGLLYLGQTATAATLPPQPQPLTPLAQITAQQTITDRDIVVVFDVSGSMEYETPCFDCWVRVDSNNPDYPNNGYFNPLPFNTAWLGAEPSQQATIPNSGICTQPAAATVNSDNRYLVHEAELYSYESGDWSRGGTGPADGDGPGG